MIFLSEAKDNTVKLWYTNISGSKKKSLYQIISIFICSLIYEIEKINNISYGLSRFYHKLSYKATFKM